MPLKNEHAARQQNPRKYFSFRRKNIGRGISFIFGLSLARLVLNEGPIEVQSIRFDAKRWSPKKAREWLKAHNFKTKLEIASG